MRKILPVGKPLANGYQFYAFPLAILANRDDTLDWILSNYVQVAQDLRGQNCDVPFCFYLFDYAISPWLDVVHTGRDWVSRHTADVGRLIRDTIADDRYVYLIADDYHIPEREFHGVKHFPHDILVHGFDDEQRTFQVLGFDVGTRFRSTTVSHDDLVAAHESLDRHGVPDTPFVCYRLRTDAEYEFHPPYIASAIVEYLDGTNTSEHFRQLRQPWQRAYGTAAYPYLHRYVHAYAAREVPYDVRHFHVLWEHKRLMTMRLRRLADFCPPVGELVGAAQEVETKASALRNSLIRYRMMPGKPGFVESAVALLTEIEQAERTVLARAVDLIGT